jgi:hypothetical protein
VLLVSPFYGLADTDEADAFLAMNTVTSDEWGSTTEARLGWDDATANEIQACEKEREQGRPGYCHFQVDHINAAIDVGAAAVGMDVPANTQVVASAGDLFSSISRVEEVAAKGAHYCAYSNANGALVSDYSSPWEERWWRQSVMHGSAQFLAHGKEFATTGQNTCDADVGAAMGSGGAGGKGGGGALYYITVGVSAQQRAHPLR